LYLLKKHVNTPFSAWISCVVRGFRGGVGSEELVVVGMFVPNGVAGAEPNPLGNGPVLLLGLGQLLLDLERLVALLGIVLLAFERHGVDPGCPSRLLGGYSRKHRESKSRAETAQKSCRSVATYRHFDGVVEVSESVSMS
jgi:hypothetical protein